MGAIQENNAIYLSIANGKLSRRVKQPTETSVERVTSEGNTVHEEIYKGWQGRITNIQVREHTEYGKFWNVTLTDENGDAIIQMNYSSGYSSAFLKTLPNVDFTKDVTITPFMKMEGDKKKTTVFISQDGQSLKHFFSRDNTRGLPSLVKLRVKGKEQWDDSDMMEFLERMVNEEILPKLKKHQPAAAKPVTAETIGGEGMMEEKDDLPF